MKIEKLGTNKIIKLKNRAQIISQCMQEYISNKIFSTRSCLSLKFHAILHTLAFSVYQILPIFLSSRFVPTCL